jgi:hypothetical protein
MIAVTLYSVLAAVADVQTHLRTLRRSCWSIRTNQILRYSSSNRVAGLLRRGGLAYAQVSRPHYRGSLGALDCRVLLRDSQSSVDPPLPRLSVVDEFFTGSTSNTGANGLPATENADN